MVATLLYIIAGLLAAPALSYLLLGEYESGLIAMITLCVIYGGGWVMSVVARHMPAGTPAPRPPTPPRARFDTVDAEYHILSRTYQIEAPSPAPRLRPRLTGTPAEDDGAA